MAPWRAARGLALAELLVALAVVGLLMAGIFALLDASQRAYGSGAARVEAQQSARVGLERMARELREAGLDPVGTGLAAIVVAEPTRVTFQRDLNANGVVDATRERVTFLLRGDVLRRDAGGGAQPVVNAVDGLVLTYYDAAGRPTAAPAEVTSMRIELRVRGRGAGAIQETQVTLRNVPR